MSIRSRKEELVSDLSSGLVETFDASKDSSEVGKSVRLIFEDISEVKKSQFELLGNILDEEETNKSYEVIIVNRNSETGKDKYSVGYIRLDMLKYRSIKKIFNEVEIEIDIGEEDSRMPYNIFKELSSNRYLSEEEVREKYNQQAIDLSTEDIIKRNSSLY